MKQQIDTLAQLGTSGDRHKDRTAACVQLATMMGALLLARATHGDPIADEIVSAARGHLTQTRGSLPRRSAKRGGKQ